VRTIRFLAMSVAITSVAATHVVYAVVFDSQPEVTGARHVMIVIQGEDGELLDFDTGESASPPSLDAIRVSAGGTLRWVLEAEKTDSLGIRHVSYRQRLFLPWLGIDDGVAVAGGRLTFRYAADGTLQGVNGALYDDIAAVGPIAATNTDEARALATAVAVAAQIPVQDDAFVAADVRARLNELTMLRLRSKGDGRTFSFVWTVPLRTDDGAVVATAIDAGTADIYRTWNPNPHLDPCAPDSTQGVSTYARPQRGYCSTAVRLGLDTSVYARYVSATPTTVHGASFTHEASWPNPGSLPAIEVFMGQGADACGSAGSQLYKMLPVKTGLNPTYNDTHNPYFVPGCAASDAMYKTRQTMAAFAQPNFDWNGYDGQGSTARIVVYGNCPQGVTDNAFYNYVDTSHGPFESVVICRRPFPNWQSWENPGDPDSSRPYSLAAALDVVAHEWGHAAMFSRGLGSGIWDYVWYTDSQAYHEGAAMVISHIVEWDQESDWHQGVAAEEPDWQDGEDADPGLTGERRVDMDDGAYSNGGTPSDPSDDSGEYSYHKDDPASSYGSGDKPAGHYTGHRLAVAYRLAVVGGWNPVCSRLTSALGCDLPSPGVIALDTSSASEVFFRLFTQYVDETTGWDDFADLAKQAAHDLYHDNGPPCDNAINQQKTVNQAFTAIGYPGSLWYACSCYPCPQPG